MAEFYKLNIGEWNEGTDDLTLEQEAAYLRVVNAIRLTEQPIRYNLFVLGGLWRCNERKAKRILSELIEVGKVIVDGESIINRRAVDDASNLRRTRVERQSAGSRGGVESGKSRRKILENNDTEENLLQPEKRREEKRREEKNCNANKDKSLSSLQGDNDDFETFISVHPKPRETKLGRMAWDRALASGADPGLIIGAARRYAEESKAFDRDKVQFSDNWLVASGWEKYPPMAAPKAVSEDDRIKFLAKMINGDGYLPPSTISGVTARQLVDLGLVTLDRMRERGFL